MKDSNIVLLPGAYPESLASDDTFTLETDSTGTYYTALTEATLLSTIRGETWMTASPVSADDCESQVMI